MTKQRGITVSQLNNYIKQVFEAEEMLHNIEVVGDISQISIRGNGAYFSISDKDATIPCSCFIPAKLQNIKQGSHVIVRGNVSYWNKAGKISFSVTHIEEFGLGELLKRLQELQEKLKQEGLFDKKKSLPEAAKTIGVITSETGAVIHDIINVATRRNKGINILLFPVKVQGVGAENEIIEGIQYFNSEKNVDVIIVARGGGSAEDLMPFNSESLARAAFASEIPLVSAVGHETDWTLIDFVSDLRAPTPSAAAEILVKEIVSKRDQILKHWNMIKLLTTNALDKYWARLESSWQNAKHIVNAKLSDATQKLELMRKHVKDNNPMRILEKGYARISRDKKDILDISKLKENDTIKIRMYNGTATAEIKEIQRDGL